MRLALLLTLVLAPALARAQSIADRQALAGWDDSLRSAATLPRLRQMESSIGRGASVDGLRRALFTERHGELAENRQEVELAISSATWTAGVHQDWAWPRYLMGRSYIAMQSAGWLPIQTKDGVGQDEDFGDKLWQNLRAALARDPQLEGARRWMIPQFVAGGDRLLRPDQIALLREEATRPAADPDLLLVWARYLRTGRHYDSALAVFDRAAATGGDRSRLALERARTLRALHDSTGATAAYWDGLDHVTAAGRELYRYDLAWITSKDSLAAFDRTADADLAHWMHRFWDERDAAAANHPGERLNEHLRRWVVAFARYRVRSPWRRTPFTGIDIFYDNSECMHIDEEFYDLVWRMPPTHAGDLRNREWLLDHRGVIYLRHGEPLSRIGGTRDQFGIEDFTSGPPADTPDSSNAWSAWLKNGYITGPLMKGSYGALVLAPRGRPGDIRPTTRASVDAQTLPQVTESWLYNINGEQRLLHFRDSYAIGMYDATTLASFLPYSPSVWLARSGTLPEYHTAGERIAYQIQHPTPNDPPSCWDEIRAGNARSRVDADSGVRNDTDSPPFLRPWHSVIQMFALGSEQTHNGEVLLTFALGGQSMRGDTLADGRSVYEIHFRIVAWEQASGRTITVDTARRFAWSQPLPVTEALTSWIEIPLPTGNWQLAVRATQDDPHAGAYALRRGVAIDAGPELAISDVVTGVAGAAPWHAPDGATFPINAVATWPAGGSAELYYEVRGLAAGQSFATTIEVRPVDPAITQSVRIATTDLAAGPVTPVRRSLGLTQLPAGAYRMEVIVEAAGHRATRIQEILINPPK